MYDPGEVVVSEELQSKIRKRSPAMDAIAMPNVLWV
jgi:hypothetical protein